MPSNGYFPQYFPAPGGTSGTASLTATTLGQGDTYSQPQGTTRQYLCTMVDPQTGSAVNPAAYGSGNSLRAYIWEGASGPQLATPTVTWESTSAGVILMEVDPSHLASLAIQPYPVRIEVQVSGYWQTAWEGWIDVDFEPATTTSPMAPGLYADMLKFGGARIKQLLTEDSRAGFLEERAEAWVYLRQVLLARYRPPGGQYAGLSGLQTAFPGYWVSVDYPNPVIANYLDSGFLIGTDQIKEILARKALAILFDRQADPEWERASAREHRRADAQISSLVAGIDTVGNGYPTVVINCGVINTRDI
jgi:hypothetical protein